MKIDQTQKNIPKEWKISKASFCIDVRDGTHATPKPTEIGVPLITSKNIINGELNLFDSYNVSNNDAQEINKRSKVNSGDILVSMIGTVGEAAIIKNEPNFVVKNVGIFKTGSKVILPTFLILQFHSVYLQNKIKSLSSGGIQKFISLGQLRKLPILLPPIPEQNRIVAVLETWDGATEKLAKKIEIKKEIKRGLMRSLLFGKKRLGEFKDKWQTVEIGELLDYEQPTKYIVSGTDYSNDYITPVLTANKGFILGYTDETEGIYKNSPVIIFDDFTMDNKFVEFEFKVKSSAIKMLIAKNKDVNLKFVFERMQLICAVIGEHRRHYLSEYQYITIDIPCIDEQVAIANIFTTADKEIEGLQQKLSILKDQKKYLLNNLITGAIRTPETLSTGVQSVPSLP